MKKNQAKQINNVIPFHNNHVKNGNSNVVEETHYKFKYDQLLKGSMKMMLKTLELKDKYTFEHSTRVAYFCAITGAELGLSQEEILKLEMAGLFHDIGKIGVQDNVLNKPERLDDQEFLTMKKHPENSGEILKLIPEFEEIANYARFHHERYDGRGYPEGLKGDDIPLFSRIILIADTFDAMTSTRPYRKGLDHQIAFSELNEFSGSQFDPKIVECFIRAIIKQEKNKVKSFKLYLYEEEFSTKAA